MEQNNQKDKESNAKAAELNKKVAEQNAKTAERNERAAIRNEKVVEKDSNSKGQDKPPDPKEKEKTDKGANQKTSRAGSMIADGIKAAGKVIGSILPQIAQMGSAAIKVGGDFEAGMSAVEAATGASGQQLSLLEAKAREMGTTTQFSTMEVVSAMQGMAASGSSVEEILSGIEGTLYEASGATKEMAAIRMDNLQGDVKLLNSAMSDLGISVYQKAQEPLREMTQFATEAVGALGTAFSTGGFSGLGPVLGEQLSAAGAMLAEYLPQLLTQGMALVQSLLTGLAQAITTLLPQLLPGLIEAVMALVSMLAEGIPTLTETAVGMIDALREGIGTALPSLIEKAPIIIEQLATSLGESAPKLLLAGANLIMTLGMALLSNLPQIGRAAIDIVGALAGGIISYASKMCEAALSLASTFVENIRSTDWIELGRNIIDGIVNGIVANAEKLYNAAKEAAKDALEGIKDFLGINSPSIVMREVVGKNLMRGMAVGTEEETPVLLQQMREMGGRLVLAAEEMQARYASAPAVSGGAAPAGSGFGMGGVTIHWYGGGEDADVGAIARALGQRTERAIRGRGIL